MPLLEKSLNVQEVEPRVQKRTLDHFLTGQENQLEVVASKSTEPPASSPGLTESGSSPLDTKSLSPNRTPIKIELADVVAMAGEQGAETATVVSSFSKVLSGQPAGLGQPSAKRVKISPEEKAAKAQEKAAKAEEREKKKQEKEIADKAKADEKAAKAAAKAEKDEEKAQKKRKREEEAEKKAKEAEKKARSQMTLTSMFAKAPATPNKAVTGPVRVPITEDARHASPAATPSKTPARAVSTYEHLFKPFFVKENVRMAPNRTEMDQQTLDAKSRIIDEYIQGQRKEITSATYNWMEALQIPFKLARGRTCPSVKKIMADLNGNEASTETREALNRIPLKSLKFDRDVRPPYIGTMTSLPNSTSLRKLARTPSSREILPLNYDYDSEAEWQEDDGEDVDIDEDDEDLDNDEDMDDFLDDTEDAGVVRATFSTSSSMEPDSTGLCWENHNRLVPLPRMYKYRLEFINEKHHHSINPWSSEYWDSPSKPTRGNDSSANAASGPARPALNSTTAAPSPAPMAPPRPSNAFQALVQTGHGANSAAVRLQKDKEEELKSFVRARLQMNPSISKIAITELFQNEAGNESLRKTHIKKSLEELTVKTGPRKWALKADT